MAIGLLAALSAYAVAVDMKAPEVRALRLMLVMVYGALIPLSVQFMRRSPRWFAAPLLVAACVMLTAGAWIVVSPAASEDPRLNVWLSFAAAGIALVLALVAFFFPWQPRLPGEYGEPGGQEPAQNYTELWLRVAGCLVGLALFAYGWVVGSHHAAGYAMVGVGAVAILMALFFRRL